MLKRRRSRNAFVYTVVIAITGSCVAVYGLVAQLSLWQGLLLTIGSLILVSTAVFSFLELGRLARLSNTGADAAAEEEEPEIRRVIIVEPPTGAPYPHHEEHAGSEGQDQGQLTSRLSGTTPLLDLLARRHTDR